MDINQTIQEAIDKLIQEKLPAMVAAKAEKLLNELLGDIFRSYSDMGKQIKEKIEKQLDINLQQFELADYNVIVSKAINERLAGLVNEDAIKPIMSLVQDAVGFMEKKTIKLSEIWEMIKQASMDEDESEMDGQLSFYAEKNHEHDWVDVCFDIDGKKSQHDCAIHFMVSGKNGGTIFSFHTGNYRQKKGSMTPARMTMLDQLEHKIFRLYSAQVKIEVDETDFENDWSRYN